MPSNAKKTEAKLHGPKEGRKVKVECWLWKQRGNPNLQPDPSLNCRDSEGYILLGRIRKFTYSGNCPPYLSQSFGPLQREWPRENQVNSKSIGLWMEEAKMGQVWVKGWTHPNWMFPLCELNKYLILPFKLTWNIFEHEIGHQCHCTNCQWEGIIWDYFSLSFAQKCSFSEICESQS